MNQSRICVSHNKNTQILTIVCTQDIERDVTEAFKKLCPIEMMQAERTIEDAYNDEGDMYKDCVVITTKVALDVIEPFFENAICAMRKNIGKSINHSDN